jgi:LysM repeat protein
MDFSFISDEALRAKAMEVASAAIEEATEGLKTKNNELLGKIRKWQKLGDIDPVDYQQTISDNERMTGELSAAQKTIKKLTADSEAFKKNYEAEAGVTHKLIVQNGLTAALIEAKVKPELMKAVVALLSPQATLKAEGDSRIAVVGDKPLADYVSEWAKSDEGKHYVAAAVNRGGGADGGGNGKGDVKEMTRVAFDAQDPVKKSEFIKGGGVVIN